MLAGEVASWGRLRQELGRGRKVILVLATLSIRLSAAILLVVVTTLSSRPTFNNTSLKPSLDSRLGILVAGPAVNTVVVGIYVPLHTIPITQIRAGNGDG